MGSNLKDWVLCILKTIEIYTNKYLKSELFLFYKIKNAHIQQNITQLFVVLQYFSCQLYILFKCLFVIDHKVTNLRTCQSYIQAIPFMVKSTLSSVLNHCPLNIDNSYNAQHYDLLQSLTVRVMSQVSGGRGGSRPSSGTATPRRRMMMRKRRRRQRGRREARNPWRTRRRVRSRGH